MSSVRIALLSDDRLFCDGVASILRSDDAFEVVVYDSVAALETVGPQLRAAILLIDSRLEGAMSLVGSARLASASMLVAAPNDAAWCREALCAGADGVLPKNSGAGALLSAVRAVADGSVWAPRRVMAECIRHLVTTSVSRRIGAATLDRQLSRREREIFRQAASGLANKEAGVAARDRRGHGEGAPHAHFPEAWRARPLRTGGALPRRHAARARPADAAAPVRGPE